MKQGILAATLLLSLTGCALFQQVPGRATNGTIQTEAGAVWGKSTASPGGCPAIEFMGAQNVGEVAATCSGSGAEQSLTAKSIDANSVLQTAIAGQTALGQMVTDLAKQAMTMAAAAAAGPAAPIVAPMLMAGGVRRPAARRSTAPLTEDCAATGRTLVIDSAGAHCE